MSTTTRPVPRGETRRRILDVAMRLFAEQGYAGTSVRDIAAELDITKAAVHYHFPCKEEIVEALLAPYVSDYVQVIEQAEPGPAEPGELLHQLAELASRARPLMSVVGSDPSIATVLHGRCKEDLTSLGERLAQALVGPDAPPADVLRAHACLAAFFGAHDYAVRTRGMVDVADLAVLTKAALAALRG
ncbi:MAG: hypothetical protein JWL64_675 [Frankiales bacterium]|nr:hypothetical protein [Frankiales bacterium]